MLCGNDGACPRPIPQRQPDDQFEAWSSKADSGNTACEQEQVVHCYALFHPTLSSGGVLSMMQRMCTGEIHALALGSLVHLCSSLSRL